MFGIASLAFIGCEYNTPASEHTKYSGVCIFTYEIHGEKHEYLCGSGSMTHLPNCAFCRKDRPME